MMKTIVQKIDRENFSEAELKKAAEIIQSGGLVAFPTETVYGLGANALDAKACYSIYEAKRRPHDNPLIVHVAEPGDYQEFASAEDTELFSALAQRFMPGPLTVILKKKPIIPDEVTVGLGTVAIRCPSDPIAHALICASGVPIAAPSANLSGKPSPTTARHVIDDMTGRIHMILDGGSCEVGLESTVISLKGDKIRLLRPGFVTVEDLREVCDKVEVDPAVLSQLSADAKPESPGMKYRHYAPSAPVTMVSGKEERVLAFFSEQLVKGNGVLCFDEDVPLLSAKESEGNLIPFGKREDFLSQAQNLFNALRQFDNIKHVKHIYARNTALDHLGLAVSNRLLRACAFDKLELE